MKVLVVGSGGREHALAWKLAHSPRITRTFVAPGNAGTAVEPGCSNVEITDIGGLLAFARDEKIAFTVVGPEAPLAAGIVDAFRAAEQRIFGPSQAAARLESSKSFAKSFMQRHGIPSAAYASFDDAAAARRYVDDHGPALVVKADGLAAGKGVVVAATRAQAHAAVDAMMVTGAMGAAGRRIIIEEHLRGEEASFIAMIDGKNVLALATSQDHKRLRDGDEGPNTGGMGAYSPAPVVTPRMHARIMREVIDPVVNGMIAEGTPYTGFLYAGLMIDGDRLDVLEFNCRLGDPETQPILLRLKSDLAGLLEAAFSGTLDKMEPQWDRRVALGVVLAAHGYPESARKGDNIEGLPPDEATDLKVFHAGTARQGERVVTAGGRVLCVTALGDSVRLAQRRAYEAAEQIRFDGVQMRRDIGHRAAGTNRRGN
ncbi:MAG: phosphoribosylamine--glycine ligase [Burkholderiales bacterium]|nr:phosphoribosylamine--glycine ligase [Burkholderiales bacterium]